MTDDASDLVRRLADRENRPAYAGIRIHVNPSTRSLSMELADRPQEGDLVVSGIGGLVFLTGSAAERLEHSTLRVRADGKGSSFYLTD